VYIWKFDKEPSGGVPLSVIYSQFIPLLGLIVNLETDPLLNVNPDCSPVTFSVFITA
jgi:hypothetical protein